jgi:hypothetical protein
MRTATIIKEYYEYSELSDAAKQKAREWLASCDPWGGSEEWWDSAQAFAGIAPISIDSADYHAGHVRISWNDDADVSELKGLRAWKWLQNNGWFDWAAREQPGACTLTGFCGDAPFADPLVGYSKTPLRVPDLKQVFYECAQKWVFEVRADMEHAYSDEALEEAIEANEYEFDAEGNIQ